MNYYVDTEGTIWRGREMGLERWSKKKGWHFVDFPAQNAPLRPASAADLRRVGL